eukprot:TRINITY_DN17705_c0_g1_i4.p1 TRINITY_DN17705_c0_g1~~TRINITY_DN17705_c0_g1_i4.p1  ORF type:complete len:229 (+),score=35.71 TRINITY_DN17705_c0_g1_i4:48-689(+)
MCIRDRKKHSDYYQQYQRQIPVYVREQHEWSKEMFKRTVKRNKRYNDIICRNIRNAKNSKAAIRNLMNRHSHHNKTENHNISKQPLVDENPGKIQKRSIIESLPLIRNGNLSTKSSKVTQSFSLPKQRQDTTAQKLDCTPDKLLKKAVRLGKYVRTVKSKEGRQLVRAYGRELVKKLRASIKEEVGKVGEIVGSKAGEGGEKVAECEERYLAS